MSEDEIKKIIDKKFENITLLLGEHQAQSIQGFQQVVKNSIEVNINGKINNMIKMLTDYIKTDNAWKVTVEPVVFWFDNFTMSKKLALSFAKGAAWTAGTIIAIGGACATIWVVIKYVIMQATK